MVLAATNRPSELDEAILRRLPQAFEIGMPDRRERAEILKVILKGEKVEDNIDFDRIAGLCDGYTGSDLLELCKKAAYFPIRDLLDAEKGGSSSLVCDFILYLLKYLVCTYIFLLTAVCVVMTRNHSDFIIINMNAWARVLFRTCINYYSTTSFIKLVQTL